MDNSRRELLVNAHLNWLLQFKLLINDDKTVGVVDRGRIDSHLESELGQLLQSGQLTFDSPLIANIVRDIHATFHGVAALVLDLHNKNSPVDEIAEYLTVLDQLSDQLTTLIRKARIQ